MSAARTLVSLAELVGGSIEGDASVSITGVCGLEEARPGELSFFSNNRYKVALGATKASAVLVGSDAPARGQSTYVRVANPYLAFARISQAFHPVRSYPPGVAQGARVHPEAQVHATATVMASVTIEKGASIGARAVLFPGVYVGESAVVGEDTRLMPNVVIAEGCRVGARCLLHAGCVVGSDGFGFALDLEAQAHVKIPQAGIVRVEDDVEIGANSTLDRATHGETVVGRGTKIDNLVQVAHNVTIGPLGILCAQAGVSGSTTLGMGVMLGGQVGLGGHITIGDMARVAAQSGVMSDLPPGEAVAGAPAFAIRDFMKSSAVVQRLPELQKELRALRKRVEELEQKGHTP